MKLISITSKLLYFLICFYIFSSCQKDSIIYEIEEKKFDYNQLSLELKWAITRSTIWIEHIDSTINHSNFIFQSENKLKAKISLYEPIGAASIQFQNEIIKQKNIDNKTFYLEHWKNIISTKRIAYFICLKIKSLGN